MARPEKDRQSEDDRERDVNRLAPAGDGARKVLGHPEFDALIPKAQPILMRDMPIIPIYIYTRTYLMSTRVKGRHPNLIDYIAFDQISLDPGN